MADFTCVCAGEDYETLLRAFKGVYDEVEQLQTNGIELNLLDLAEELQQLTDGAVQFDDEQMAAFRRCQGVTVPFTVRATTTPLPRHRHGTAKTPPRHPPPRHRRATATSPGHRHVTAATPHHKHHLWSSPEHHCVGNPSGHQPPPRPATATSVTATPPPRHRHAIATSPPRQSPPRHPPPRTAPPRHRHGTATSPPRHRLTARHRRADAHAHAQAPTPPVRHRVAHRRLKSTTSRWRCSLRGRSSATASGSASGARRSARRPRRT